MNNGLRAVLLIAGISGLASGIQAGCLDSVYLEPFDTGSESFSIVNGADPTAGWAFDDSCPAAADSPGGPGTLRWGSFADCASFGAEPHIDTASTPLYVLPADCVVTFDYNLSYDEPSLRDAEIRFCVDGPCATVLSLADGNLVNDGLWHTIDAVLPPGTLRIEFVGSTETGDSNTGTGWSIDDVEISCPLADCFVPAVDPGGAAALLVAISVVFVALLLRRRTAVGVDWREP